MRKLTTATAAGAKLAATRRLPRNLNGSGRKGAIRIQHQAPRRTY
ncbi:hypothetical protein ACFWBN_00350 [Streptomyces sp. NPDC059989]